MSWSEHVFYLKQIVLKQYLLCCREHCCDRSSGGGPENRQTKEHSETELQV